MGIQNLDFGTGADDDGEFLRTAMPKVQSNFDELYRDTRYSISLLKALSTAQQADVLNATNALDITEEIADLLADVEEGTTVDARMLRGEVTWAGSPLNALHTKAIRFLTGDVHLTMDFNDTGGLRLPSKFHWHMQGTLLTPTIKLENLGGTNWPNDNSPSMGLIQTYFAGEGRTCSGTSGASTIVVSDATGIHLGTRIAILGINLDTSLSYTLNGAINSSVTALALSGSMASQIDPMFGHILIDSEIIRGLYTTAGGFDATYTALSGRGKLGTTAASHSHGATVTVLQSQLYTVVGISGTTLTLNSTLPRTFSSASFRFGSVGSRLSGWGEIDAEVDRNDPPANVINCFGATLASRLRVDGQISLRRGGVAGVMLRGTKDCHAHFDVIDRCGNPSNGLGASSWFFGGNYDSSLTARHVSDGNISLAVDNKSAGVTSMGLDLPNVRCHSDFRTVEGHVNGIDITASHDGVHIIGYSDTSAAAIGIFDSADQSAAIPALGNYVRVERQKTYRALAGNSLSDNTIVDYAAPVTASLALASAAALGTGTPLNVVSISLPPGLWDVDGATYYNTVNTVSVTDLTTSIGATSVTLDFTPGAFARLSFPATVYPTSNPAVGLALPTVRLSLLTTTTIYLVARATFTVSTMAVWGAMTARRVTS